MSLKEYNEKRDFTKTSEPKGIEKSSQKEHIFVVQKHKASQLHYDFRLEYNGIMLSWAVPKGVSMDPEVKRLAIQTEDHPLDYASFEGNIPEGHYGAGDVIVWDNGTYTLPDTNDFKSEEKEMKKMIEKGHIFFYLKGKKLKGEFSLIKTHYGHKNSWLLVKAKDEFATKEDILEKNQSVISDMKL